MEEGALSEAFAGLMELIQDIRELLDFLPEYPA